MPTNISSIAIVFQNLSLGTHHEPLSKAHRKHRAPHCSALLRVHLRVYLSFFKTLGVVSRPLLSFLLLLDVGDRLH